MPKKRRSARLAGESPQRPVESPLRVKVPRRSKRVPKRRREDDDDVQPPPKRRKTQKRKKVPATPKTPRKRFDTWERNTIASKQNWRCNFCQNLFGPFWEVDHLVPLQYGGTNRYQNLQALCVDCHRFKTFYLDSFIIKPIVKDLTEDDMVVREEIEKIQQDHLFKMMCRDSPGRESLTVQRKKK